MTEYEEMMSTLGCLLSPAAPARKVMAYITEQNEEIAALRQQLADAEKVIDEYRREVIHYCSAMKYYSQYRKKYGSKNDD